MFAIIVSLIGIVYSSAVYADHNMTLKHQHKNIVQQHRCLALNVYHEARGEPFEGQLAVAKVTLNRVEHSFFPNTICEVVYQPKQFSWTHVRKQHKPADVVAWENSKQVAAVALSTFAPDPTNGALFYHTDYVSPTWVSAVDFSIQIDDHIFYTWDGEWE